MSYPRRLLSLPISGEGTSILAVDVIIEPGDSSFAFIADCDIDADGSGGNPYNDPYFQPDTSYHYKGEALNPYVVPFGVLPSSVIKAVKPVVLGCYMEAHYYKTGITVAGIVGDVGPTKKLGEVSCRMAELLGMNPHPNHGGEDSYNGVLYRVWPGRVATIDGITYPLQPFGS
jgi:hypothetical protein